MLNLTHANRYERLSARLLDDLADAPAEPFTAEHILVPGTAIRRRLEMDHARRFGVCANVSFGFLARWLWEQMGRVVAVDAVSPFAKEQLAWRVFRRFGDERFCSGHPRLAGYLGQAGRDPLMRFELAQRVARLLEQYITYRQDWVKSWAEGRAAGLACRAADALGDEAWQAALWRGLLDDLRLGAEHPAEAFFRAVDGAAGGERPDGLPARVALFCPTDLPPLYLHILAGFSRLMEVNLYVLNPCREYWFELIDRKQLAAREALGRGDYHEVGNPLLAGWGRQAQSFLTLLGELPAELHAEADAFLPAPPGTLLATVQNAILDMTDPAPGSVSLDSGDAGIEVHVCHALTRELEVLHDRLLDRFERQPGLSPADVLVVMPDLETAAPLIDAVFGTAPDGRKIPYAITGLPRAVANPVAAGLRALLQLLTSRFPASEVFALLRRPLVSARYGLSDADRENIHGWMREAGIRWGLDAGHRARLDLPEMEDWSLRDGIDRLYLGYAVASLAEPLAGRLPAGDVEGTAALALGAFDQFVANLERACREAGRPAAAAVWRERLHDWLDAFFSEDRDSLEDFAEVRRAVNGLCDALEAAGVSEPLPLETVGRALAERLEDSPHGALPSGVVTFAGMSPMRALPYRMICILGLNDGVFPGVGSPDEFDLIARSPRLGDRQRRLDDRNLFLDLLLAARERLHLSYTGQNLRDNSALTPSILLAELEDYLACLTGRQDRPWRIRHPLQAFSRRYFAPEGDRDTGLFSYAAEYAAALQSPAPLTARPAVMAEDDRDDTPEDERPEPREPGARFFPAPLPWRIDDPREVSLADLRRFFRNPCRFLLERRMQLSLPGADEELADDEPFLPDYPSRGSLAERLLPAVTIQGTDLETLLKLAKAGREYPPGALGELLLRDELGLIGAFGRRYAERTREPLLPPRAASLELDVAGETWRLSGALNDLRPGGLARGRYDDRRPTDYLAGWLDHLFLNALEAPGVDPRTVWIARDGGYELAPCGGARERLAVLVEFYRLGQSRPLHFFPKSAWAYATALDERPDQPEAAWTAARKKWEISFKGHGESADPAYVLCLRGEDAPLNAEFAACASAVFGPLRAHLGEIGTGHE